METSPSRCSVGKKTKKTKKKRGEHRTVVVVVLKERAKEKERNFISQTINTFGSIQYTPFLLLLFSDNACASIGWPRESTTEATAAAVDNANWRLLIVFSSSLLFFFPSSSSKRKFIIARETVVVVLFLLCLLNETVVVLVLLRAAVVVDAVIKLISFIYNSVFICARIGLLCCYPKQLNNTQHEWRKFPQNFPRTFHRHHGCSIGCNSFGSWFFLLSSPICQKEKTRIVCPLCPLPSRFCLCLFPSVDDGCVFVRGKTTEKKNRLETNVMREEETIGDDDDDRRRFRR